MAPPTSADFASLTSALTTLSTNLATNTAALGTNGGSGGSGGSGTPSLAKSLDNLTAKFTGFNKNLEKLTSTLTETQKQFGVNLATAAQIQADAFIGSVQSIVESFNSLDLTTGLGDVSNTVGSALGELITGNFDNAKKELLQATDQLKASRAGVSDIKQPATPTEIRAATSTLQKEFGTINADTGKTLAEFAKTNGISVQQLVTARRALVTQTMGDLSKVSDVQSQFMARFQEKGLSASVAMEAIGKYSDLMARNGLRFADSFARAAADAKKIGVDLGKVDQIGDSIIGDFEGFLEKTSELGAMGFNLDTNSLAQLAESGDTGALFNELRSQLAATGKDITKLRRSEQLALSGAFGISMADMQRLAGKTPDENAVPPEVETNSLLNHILTAVMVLAVPLGLIAGSLSTIATVLSVGGTIASALAFLTPAGLIGAAILAIAAIVAKFTADSFEEQKKLKEAAKTAAIGGDYAGATSLVNKAMVPETMTNMAMMGPEAGMIAGLEAVKERDRQQQQLNNIYRLQQLSPGNIGPSNPFRGMESGIDRLPQFAPHATSGDRYNQRLADEAVLRGQLTTPPVKKASGGLVTGPGTGKSDSIPTRLSNGEFVINADMVKKLGLPFLNKLNADTLTDMSIKALGSRVLGKLPGVTSMVTKIAKPIPALGSAIGGALDGYDEYKNSNSVLRGIGKGLTSTGGGLLGNLLGGAGGTLAGGPLGGVLGSAAGGLTGSGIANKLFDKFIPKGLAGNLLGKATGLLSGGGLKGLAGNLLGKVGLGGIGSNLLGGLAGGPMGMLGSLAAPLLKKIPLIGGALSSIAGGPSKLIGSALGKLGGSVLGKLGGSALGKLGGLFGKKATPVASAMGAMMPEMSGLMSRLPMLSGMMGGSQEGNQNISVNTSGIEQKLDQKLSNFITALSNIQVNMDGTKVGKLLVNVNDAAMTVGVFGTQSR